MAQYSNANLQDEGAEFFTARLKEFGPRLTDVQKALYLSAIGLRAQRASSVPLLQNRLRERHDRDPGSTQLLSGGQVFVVNWIAGIVRTELPGFHQRVAAKNELAWCVENADKAPHAGWLREVYSGIDNHLHNTLPLGPRWRPQIFPRPESALALLCQEHYQEEFARDFDAPGNFGEQFFGERFSLDDMRSFKPDVMIDGRTNLKIGGTRIELILVQGGETHDAMFIYTAGSECDVRGRFHHAVSGGTLCGGGRFSGTSRCD
jgi:hypothetical protein